MTSPGIAVVVPAYNVASHIGSLLGDFPSFISHVIVVNDCSTDTTSMEVLQAAGRDPRIVLLSHESRQGVGGAMITGYRHACSLGAVIVVKMDGDGQMSAADLPAMIAPLVRGEADYSKGNRFVELGSLRRMPATRRIGNLGLSFLAKAATGYWNCFDPTNGFVAVRGGVLAQLSLQKLDRTYFFEQSMLSELYLMGAVVKDVPLPSRYGQEESHLRIGRVLRQFPPKLARAFLRRLILKNFLYDFTMESVYLLLGLPMLAVGVLYGAYHWFLSIRTRIPAHTGTVVIPAMLIILGVQLLLAAIGLDMASVPIRPLSKPLNVEGLDLEV